MRLFLLLLAPSLIFAAKILSYNVYDRSDRVDIMLSFDTPYEGSLRQVSQNDTIIVKLDGATIESPKIKSVGSPFLGKLTITPIGDGSQIIATVAPSVQMQASKTSDAFGLRLRFAKPSSATAAAPSASASAGSLGSLPTKPDGEFDRSYMIVVAILLIGIGVLFWLKRRIAAVPSPVASGAPNKVWSFMKKENAPVDNVSIRFQKALDQQNRVVMIDYAEESYLIILGSNNLLLDKYHGRKPVTQNDFEQMLQTKHEELDRFFQIDQQRNQALQSYKEKASGLE